MRGDRRAWPDWPDRRDPQGSRDHGREAPQEQPARDDGVLRLVEAGWSFEEIHAEIERVSGTRTTSSAVSVMLSRAVWDSTTMKHRGFETVPWRVQPAHLSEYAVRMLRLLGRRRSGIPLPASDDARLGLFLSMLEEKESVVGYAVTGAAGEGFLLLPASLRGGPNADVPVRVQRIDYWDAFDFPPVPAPDHEQLLAQRALDAARRLGPDEARSFWSQPRYP